MREKRNIPLTLFAFIIGIILVFPIYLMAVGSLRLPDEVFSTNLLPTKLTFAGFTEVFQGNIFRPIWNSFIVSATVTVVAMVFHAMAGYALARFRFPLQRFIFGWMISTLMVPFSVIMIPLFMITKNLGMANSYYGLIVPAIFNAYGIFLFRQFYRDFPQELEEAAYMEGCSRAGTFFRIALPLSASIIAPLTIGFFLANWNAYLWPLIINQKESLQVIQVALANLVGGGYHTPWNVVLAGAVTAAIPTFLLFFLMQKYFVNGIKMTGIK